MLLRTFCIRFKSFDVIRERRMKQQPPNRQQQQQQQQNNFIKYIEINKDNVIRNPNILNVNPKRMNEEKKNE